MYGPGIEPSPEIWHRDDLPLLANWRKCWRAVEVGVDQAEWSSLFLSRWQGHQWWGVDQWLPYDEQRFDREADYHMACIRIERFASRAKLIRGPSIGAAKLFAPGSVDFVYIDAAHDYDSVRADIAAWWPKLSKEGILAGHDFDDHVEHRGVKDAVTEFAQAGRHTVYVTAVKPYRFEDCPSWYVYRSGLPKADWRRC